MRYFILLLFIGFVSNIQAQNDIISTYEALQAEADSLDGELKQDYDYYLSLALPFYQIEKGETKGFVPQHILFSYKKYKTPTNIESFLDYNYNLIYDLYELGERTLFVRDGKLFNIEEAGQDSNLRGTAYTLKNQEAFDALSELIIDKYEAGFKIKIKEDILPEITRIRELYDRKYAHGYRNRNILEYFINGTIATQRVKKRTNSKGILEPPARGEMIFLANPIMAVASPSLEGFRADNSSVYLMVQVLGFDYHLKNFDGFWGVSLFHASPVNVDLEFFTHPMFGLEAHYRNTFNLGFGIEYNRLGNTTNTDSAAKVFLSVALYDSWRARQPTGGGRPTNGGR